MLTFNHNVATDYVNERKIHCTGLHIFVTKTLCFNNKLMLVDVTSKESKYKEKNNETEPTSTGSVVQLTLMTKGAYS
jgi:hypothetical protein